MKKFPGIENPEPAVVTSWAAALLAVSMIFSPFLLSIAMWAFVFVALWQSALVCRTKNLFRAGAPVRNSALVLQQSFRSWWQNKALRWMALLFVVVAVSGIWSDDQAYWLERTRVRIPFFILPWAFANLPKLSPKQLRTPLYLLVFAVAITCIGIGINTLLHYDAVMEGLSKGQPIPVPRHHIRFNLIVVTAVLSGAWFWFEGFYLFRRSERPWLGVAVVFLFAFVHFLSVRSGIAALYVIIFAAIALFILQTRKWRLGLIALLGLALLPFVAVKIFPSLQQRIAYMRYDWERFRLQNGYNYSDSERWISLQTGWIMWREHPWLGVGAGDLPDETQRIVTERFPAYHKTPRLPHNQFLYIMAGTGLIGLFFSLWALLAPFTLQPVRRNRLFLLFQLLVFVSFLVEYTLETSIGAAFYLFYTLWLLKLAETPIDDGKAKDFQQFDAAAV